jgi:hypothetical protein
MVIVQISVGQDDVDLDDDRGDIEPGLTAWWKLDETSGDTAADASGHGNKGRLRGRPEWVKGYKGGGLKLDGKEDYVAIENLVYARAGLPAATVAAWLRTGSDAHQIIAAFDRNEYWRLEIGNPLAGSGLIGWDVMTDLGQIDLFSRARIHDGQWHHVAGVFNGGNLMIYIDGTVNVATTGGRTFGTGNTRFGFLGIGSEAEKFDGEKLPLAYFDGDLDDVRIYDRALSLAEIEQLAFHGPGNDNCEHAQPVGEVVDLPFDTTQATFDGAGVCTRSANLWYLYTPSCTGLATVSLCGSLYDTMLGVYTGAECSPGYPRLMACNDDFCGLQSQVTIEVDAGKQYLIEVGGFDRRTGEGVMTIACEGIDPVEFDLGDAPDSSNDHSMRMTAYTSGAGVVQAHFPTVFDDRDGRPRGPLHVQPLAVAFLGEAVSLEIDADKGADEDSVNNIDPGKDKADQDGADDGVLLPIQMPDCGWTSFDYLVNVIEPERDLWVNVWLDWNRDGDWDDDSLTDPKMVCGERHVSEWAVQNQYLFGLPAGLHQISAPAFLAWHPAKGPEKIWMRITLSEQPWTGGDSPGTPGNGGSGPAEGYDIGETEDYLIEPETGCALCEDLNDDGEIDFDDLIELIYDWIDCCM